MNTRCIKAITILATLTAAGAATASPINVAYTGMGSGSNTRITFGSTTLTAFTGQLKHNLTEGAGNASLFNGAQTAYCIDLAQRVTSNVSAFEVVSPSVVTNLVSPTLGPARAQAYTDLYSVFGSQAIAANASNDFGTAFQMLAWEIMYDYNPSLGTSSLDLSAGTVRFTNANGGALGSGILTQYTMLLTSIGTNAAAIPGLVALQSARQQDQLVYQNNVIPAPGAAALLGLSGLVLSRRRRSSH